MSTKPTLENLDRRTLELLVQAKYDVQRLEEQDAIKRLLETSIALEGKKGRGKSLSATVIAYLLRELCGRHVITIGTKLGLTPAFGDFVEITEKEFKNVLDRVQDSVDESNAAKEVVEVFKSEGIDLMYATLVFDEAYKLFTPLRVMEKLNMLFSQFMAQQRHYHCTTLLCAPSREDINRRVRQQVDWFGRCFHNKWTHQCVVRLVSGLETIPLSFNAIDDSEHPPYYEMYDSWVMTGYRRQHLEMKKF